jgi:homoserine O-acetyltransferase/O-succinyltransferase
MTDSPIANVGDLVLSSGGVLKDVQVAYRTLGRLSPDRSNAILVLHGYTSSQDMILPSSEAAEGAWDGLVGPGKAIDTERYYVICPNVLGSCHGTTGAGSVDPACGRPYGSRWPGVTASDMAASQRALLSTLGIERLVAVIGVSLGGMLAFQWAVDFPGFALGIAPVLAAPKAPPVDPSALRERLAQDPAWHVGDYYGKGDMSGTLAALRVPTLKQYGVEAVLARTLPAPEQREAALQDAARRWAAQFDANAMVSILEAIASFDVTARLGRIRARLLYVLSRTDSMFPPSLAPDVMAQLKQAGVHAQYFEIDSDAGHFASGADAELWAPTLAAWLNDLQGAIGP